MTASGFLLLSAFCSVALTLELPTWRELSRHYPGYKHKNLGKYSNRDIYAIIGIPSSSQYGKDTTGLRLSLALNRLGGAHRLGTDEFHITKKNDKDSVRGSDGQQYIYRTISYGPFLAMKYKSPELIRIDKFDPEATLNRLHGRQGIVRFVTFLKHKRQADARILLWNCNQVYQSRDYTHIHHLISVEFWELKESYCPP